MRWKEKLGKYPIPAWLFAMGTVLWCESLLHLWVTETFSAGRYLAVVCFAIGFGGLIGQVFTFIGQKNWGKLCRRARRTNPALHRPAQPAAAAPESWRC